MRFCLTTLLIYFTAISYAQKNCRNNLDSLFVKDKDILLQFVDSIAAQNLSTKNKKRHIPRFIQKAIKCQAGDFRIANAGEKYNSGDAIIGNVPRKRIKFLALNDNYLILAFEQGGIGKSDHIQLFEYRKKKILKTWKGADYVSGEITKNNIIEHISLSIKQNE